MFAAVETNGVNLHIAELLHRSLINDKNCWRQGQMFLSSQISSPPLFSFQAPLDISTIIVHDYGNKKVMKNRLYGMKILVPVYRELFSPLFDKVNMCKQLGCGSWN